MLKSILILCALFNTATTGVIAQSVVHVEPSHLQGPRPLQEQTETASIRDYLQSWKSIRAALDQNRAELLAPYFVGTAKQKLTDTILNQTSLGLHTRYVDHEHDLQIVFYSPEGLSIEILDNVQYDEQILDQKKVIATQHMNARYIVVLTPTEVRWKVRVFQASPE